MTFAAETDALDHINEIPAITAINRIHAQFIGYVVIPRTAIDFIIAAIAIKRVMPRRAIESVIARTAPDFITARTAIKCVRAITAMEQISTCAASDFIIALCPNNRSSPPSPCRMSAPPLP